MYVVVPFQLSDDGSSWSGIRAALVRAQTEAEGISSFVDAAVYPSADPDVWGECADWGSSPERVSEYHYYIVGGSDEDDETANMSIVESKVKVFESLDGAVEYRDKELHTYRWAYADTEED